MTTIKIKSAIQEADISKRLRQFQDDLLKLKLIKRGQDPVQELEGDSGNYIITVELDKTPKELLPLLESLGVPYEGTKYFDEEGATLDSESKGFSESKIKNFSHVPVSDLKSLVENVYKFIYDSDLHPRWYESRKSRISECLKEYEDISNTPAKSGSIESDLMWSTSRLDELNHNINNELGLLLEGCTRNDKELRSKAKSLGVKSEYFSYSDTDEGIILANIYIKDGKYIVSETVPDHFDSVCLSENGTRATILDYLHENGIDPKDVVNNTALVLFSNPTDVTIRYCTPDGNVGTVVVPSTEAYKKMKELASNGCTKVRITNDEHYTRDNGPRSEVKEEHEFEEMFSALRTRLETAPNDIKQHFNNLINYFSNK